MRTLVERLNVGTNTLSLEVSVWVMAHSVLSTSVAKLVKLAIVSVTDVVKTYSDIVETALLACSMF